ncbi:MAG: polysaccharide deacetylase [Hoeflea sp.]|uniref:polysaccharide deacetylase n=1 Tax=Hoeflea sp. TaxID=1940281 RepID=UPI0032ED31F6
MKFPKRSAVRAKAKLLAGGLTGAISLLFTPFDAAAAEPARPEQLILISFDGAHDNRLWERSLKTGEETGARFTYFLSCTFLISRDARKAYKAPGRSAGRSNVGFAPDRADVVERLGHIWAARQAGHEIGSHGCGHFDGKDWSKDDWIAEFDQFDRIVSNAWSANEADQPAGWSDFAGSEIKGFRAPYLSTGTALHSALAAHGLSYDASTVSNGPVVPDFTQRLARFALPMVPEGPKGRPIIAMDYNLFVRHSGGEDDPSKSGEYELRALEAFRAAFQAEYSGKRRPLQLGFHFVEMNGGAYWRALERFALETCGRPEVACITYQEAMRRLNPQQFDPDS